MSFLGRLIIFLLSLESSIIFGDDFISFTEVDNILLALLEKKASKEGKTVIAVKDKGVIVYELLRVKRLKKGF